MEGEGGAPPTFTAGSGGESDATLGVSGLVIGLAVVSCGLRFYTRMFTRQGLGWDDWMIFSAVIATLVTAALLLRGNDVDPIGLQVSENTDPRYVYTEQDVAYLKLAFVSSVLYFTIAGTTKLGILFMYNRIFWVSNGFRWQLYIASALVIGWWIGCTVSTLTNCIPLEWSWINSYADPKYCFNYNIFWMASGACEIGLDVMILALPIQAVMRMTFSLKRKITVGGIFLLGGFVIITGIVKVVLGYPPGSRVPSYSNTEVWTEVHAGMAIVCASLPIFRPLLSRISSWKGWSFLTKLSSKFSIRTGENSSQGQNSQPRSISWSAVRGSLRHITDNQTQDGTRPTGSMTGAGADTGAKSGPQPSQPGTAAAGAATEETKEPIARQPILDDQSGSKEKPITTEEMAIREEGVSGGPNAASTLQTAQREPEERADLPSNLAHKDVSGLEGPKGGPMRPNDSVV